MWQYFTAYLLYSSPIVAIWKEDIGGQVSSHNVPVRLVRFCPTLPPFRPLSVVCTIPRFVLFMSCRTIFISVSWCAPPPRAMFPLLRAQSLVHLESLRWCQPWSHYPRKLQPWDHFIHIDTHDNLNTRGNSMSPSMRVHNIGTHKPGRWFDVRVGLPKDSISGSLVVLSSLSVLRGTNPTC